MFIKDTFRYPQKCSHGGRCKPQRPFPLHKDKKGPPHGEKGPPHGEKGPPLGEKVARRPPHPPPWQKGPP